MVVINHKGKSSSFWYFGAAQSFIEDLIEQRDYEFECVENGNNILFRKKNPQDYLEHINSIYGDDHPATCSCVACERKRNTK